MNQDRYDKTINVEDHGMVTVLDGDMAKIYDEGHPIRFVTDFEVTALNGELAEVSIKKLAPKGANPLKKSYEFNDFTEIGDD